MLKMSILPVNSPKMGIFSQNVAFFDKEFSTSQFLDRLKFRGGAIACFSPCHEPLTASTNATLSAFSKQ